MSLERVQSIAYSLARVVLGLMFMLHGPIKLFALFGGIDGKGTRLPLATFPGMGGALEIVLGALILCGLFTRVAAFLACGEMAVAYFVVHQPRALIPYQNGGELAIVYCFAFMAIWAHGPGTLSLDHVIRKTPSNG